MPQSLLLKKKMKTTNQGQILLPIARVSISSVLGKQHKAKEDVTWLQQPAACFVTLTKHNQLRGCIGTVEACRSLLDDVKHNAKAAAFKDTRFSPLTAEELGCIEIEVSLLSPISALKFSDEHEAMAQLQPVLMVWCLSAVITAVLFCPRYGSSCRILANSWGI